MIGWHEEPRRNDWLKRQQRCYKTSLWECVRNIGDNQHILSYTEIDALNLASLKKCLTHTPSHFDYCAAHCIDAAKHYSC